MMHVHYGANENVKYWNRNEYLRRLSSGRNKALTEGERLKKKYEELLTLTNEYDNCFEATSTGWGGYKIKNENLERYWKIRETLERELAKWMADVRKAVNSIPAVMKRSVREQRTDPETGDIYHFTTYENKDFEAIVGFLGEITKAIEGQSGILANIKESKVIYSTFRGIRGAVLSLCETLALFIPEIMISIDQQVDLIFRLRDKGMSDIASLVEEIDQLEDNVKKCLNARTALEKRIQYYCESKGIEVKQGFYTNLDNAIGAGLTDKTKRNAIAGHYSFMSKIIHGELEANLRNTQFAVTGALNILQSLFQ